MELSLLHTVAIQTAHMLLGPHLAVAYVLRLGIKLLLIIRYTNSE